MTTSVAAACVNAVTSDFWPDILKALFGTFAGAMLAFGSSMFIDRKARRRKEITAGNLAILTLRDQYTTFIDLRNAWRRSQIQLKQGQDSTTVPLWMFQPIAGYLPDDVRIDFPALAFLMDRESFHVFNSLPLTERKYLNLIALVRSANPLAEAIQRKIEELNLPVSEMTADELAQAVGGRLILGLASIVAEIIRHFDTDGEQYRNTVAVLEEALVKRLGRKNIRRLDLDKQVL